MVIVVGDVNSTKKCTIVPNAVELKNDAEESELFHEMRVKLEGKLVIGYIGSLRELEGVNLTQKRYPFS